jgi:hypothetical protein
VRADFDDAFARYLGPLSGTSVTSINSAADAFGAPSRNPDVTELPYGESSLELKDVADVADVTDVEAAYATEERAGIQRFGS